MWRYRDYVVRSFNHDKPFDRFVREQLAGDELAGTEPATAEDVDVLIATGFLRLGQWDSTASIFQEEPRLQAEIQADLTNTTASAFLGLTMSCCQCHDHKYDPLSHADQIPATQILDQGDFASPRDEVLPGFPSVLDPHPAAIAPPRPRTSGRRTALADWIVSKDNPWTARVFVNRVWQQHFGRGLVATPNDFGITGSAPVHLPLLDWLAVEFIRSGWSVK
jgi:hypothetical protein